MTFVTGETMTSANETIRVAQRPVTVDVPQLPGLAPANEAPASDRARDSFAAANTQTSERGASRTPRPEPWAHEPTPVPFGRPALSVVPNDRPLTPKETTKQIAQQRANQPAFMPSEHNPLADMEIDDATRYFAHLDIAFADIDAHRGLMHGPLQWPQPDTTAGQERVESLVTKLFVPKERPESAYTTLILYMPAPGDPKRLEKIAGFATAMSRQLRNLVETGVIPLATGTVVHNSMARHAAAGTHPKDAGSIVRMFERKRLEIVNVSDAAR